MGIETGALTDDEIGVAYRVFATALQFPPVSAERLERRRSSWFTERAVVARDGDRIVGHAGVFPFETLLPGGATVPTAGLTRVGVLPSHRRRGALTGMMTTHLRQAHGRGEPLASLRASESAIYGRFGYGMAGLAAAVKIRTGRAAFGEPVELAGRFDVLQGRALVNAATAAYERCLVRPGMIRRPPWYWEMAYDTHLVDHPGVADFGIVHFDGRGRPDGFARWIPQDRDRWNHRESVVAVPDLFGATPTVEAGLWRFVLDLDLVEAVTTEGRPVDDPVRFRLADVRAFGVTQVWDEQWVRVVDVPAVLGARRYATDETVVLEVGPDATLPENDGRYEVGNGGCRRLRASAELRLPIDALGAVVLGGTSWAELHAAGRIVELRRGAVERADRMFRAPLRPWCGSSF